MQGFRLSVLFDDEAELRLQASPQALRRVKKSWGSFRFGAVLSHVRRLMALKAGEDVFDGQSVPRQLICNNTTSKPNSDKEMALQGWASFETSKSVGIRLQAAGQEYLLRF